MTKLEICQELGVTPSGLRMLAHAVDNHGEARAVGFDRLSAVRALLMRQGLVVPQTRGYRGRKYWTYGITKEGRAKVDEARRLGW